MLPFCASPFGKILRQVSRRNVVKWQPGSFQEMNNSARNPGGPLPHKRFSAEEKPFSIRSPGDVAGITQDEPSDCREQGLLPPTSR
jgi:hypothetical protein